MEPSDLPRWDVRRDPILAHLVREHHALLASLGIDPENPPEGVPTWEEAISGALEENVTDVARDLVESWREVTVEELGSRRVRRALFEERLHTIWGDALNGLEQLLILAFEIGQVRFERHLPDSEDPQDCYFGAMHQLHARTVQVGYEILTLLRAGYAAGAEARWRTLHEIAITSQFIATHGANVAERYVLHDGIGDYRSMKAYQAHHAAFGKEPYTEEEMERARKHHEALCTRFGEGYASDYGWAAAALKPGQPKFRPTLADLESDLDLSASRALYALASQSVHAGPRGVMDNLSKPRGEEAMLLAGASVAGLEEPGSRTALSILQAVSALIRHHPWIQDLATAAAMRELTGEILKNFVLGQQRLEEQQSDG
jgi:hypothetical protein